MNQKLLVDGPAADRARLLTQDTTSYADKRYYYLLGQALVVTRNGLTLSQVRGQVVDAAVALDIAQLGFASEYAVGKVRRKVTIFRVAREAEAQGTLSDALPLRGKNGQQ